MINPTAQQVTGYWNRVIEFHSFPLFKTYGFLIHSGLVQLLIISKPDTSDYRKYLNQSKLTTETTKGLISFQKMIWLFYLLLSEESSISGGSETNTSEIYLALAVTKCPELLSGFGLMGL